MPKGYYIKFTKEQEDQIKREYLQKPVKRLADELNVSFGRIMRFLDKNGLKIPKDLIEKRKRDSQKKKGDIPFNKGLKQSEYLSKEAIQKMARTQFKKGNIPHNSKKDGVIVSRKDNTGREYLYIRIKKGVWKLYHRYLWENKYGEIPDNYVILFKDGDTKNIELSNLEMITHRENMLRNSKNNYPREVIPSMVLYLELENKLKELQDG